MQLNLNGDMGIGTTIPFNALDVVGVAHFGGTTSPNLTTPGAYVGWNDLTGGTGETDFINNPGSSAGGFAFMFANKGGTVESVPVFMASNGNVGIGTTSPESTLDIENTTNNATITQNGQLLGITTDRFASLSPTLDVLGQSAQSNGASHLPGGLIIQWGFTNYAAANGDAGTYSEFPESFPNNCFQIVASDCDYGAHSIGALCNKNGMTSWARMFISGNWNYANTCIRWIAIGN